MRSPMRPWRGRSRSAALVPPRDRGAHASVPGENGPVLVGGRRLKDMDPDYAFPANMGTPLSPKALTQ